MKKRTHFLMAALLAVVTMCFVGCKGPDDLHVNTQDVWFGLEAGSKTIEVTANCEWTVTQNDNATWYTVTPTTGKKDGTIIVTVEPLEGSDFRSSSFVITSPKGHIRRTVFVSQNKLDFDGIINKIFGVVNVEHWVTDYYGEIIEDEYRQHSYNPYDTTTGYHLYFFGEDTDSDHNPNGVQRDHHKDSVVYWEFNYNYDPINQNLHFEFETTEGAPESYDCTVLTASDSLFRFIHMYDPIGRWERADLRKVGTITPQELREVMTRKQAFAKHKKGSPIFDMD